MAGVMSDQKRAKELISGANAAISSMQVQIGKLEKENAELKADNARLSAELDNWKGNAEGFHPDEYIKAPLDADGNAIRVGDWVYFDGESESVFAINWNGSYWEVGLSGYDSFQDPQECRLVSTVEAESDSWEKLEGDAKKAVCYIAGANRIAGCDECSWKGEEKWSCDTLGRIEMVRRAKRLAGVE